MKFIGREEEQNFINNMLKQKGYKGYIVYGRRRFGKTELAKQCLKNKGVPSIIYQCKESSESDNTSLFTEIIKKEIKQVSNTTMNATNFGFMSKSGFDLKQAYPYLFFTLEDLYSEGL